MRRAGLVQSVRVLPGDLTEEAGAPAVRALLAGGPLPSALVAGNDRAATGALDVLRRSGLDVPGDVSVRPARQPAAVEAPAGSQTSTRSRL